MALGPTQPHIQSVQGALSLGVKLPVREANHSPLSSGDVKNAWSYINTPPWRGAQLNKSTGTALLLPCLLFCFKSENDVFFLEVYH